MPNLARGSGIPTSAARLRERMLAGRVASGQCALVAKAVVALLLVLSLAETSLAQSDDQAAVNAIEQFNRQYLQAINESDIDLLARLTTEDHMMIASGGPPLAGKDALVGAMTAAFERFDFDETWTPEETVVSGDLAYQRGTFVVVARPKDGGEASRTEGNFLRIYRRQPNGEWLMVRDMFNSD